MITTLDFTLEEDSSLSGPCAEVLQLAEEACTILQQVLSGLSTLRSVGASRIAWNQPYPQRMHDEQYIARVSAQLAEIEVSRRQLDEVHGQLVEDEEKLHPLIYPSQLAPEVTSLLQTLFNMAQTRDSGIIDVFARCPASAPSIAKLAPHIDDLRTKVLFDVIAGARHEADRLAYPGTQAWHEIFRAVEQNVPKLRIQAWERLLSAIESTIDSHDRAKRTLATVYRQHLNESVLPRLADPMHRVRAALASAPDVLIQYREIDRREAAGQSSLTAPWSAAAMINGVASSMRPALTDSDTRLTEMWCPQDDPTHYWHRAMTSARQAELVALDLYRRLYGDAADVSILQVTAPSDTRWRLADIETDKRLIDIKNARRSFSSPTTYSELCVPGFKSDRQGHDVSISAFLSPYSLHGNEPEGGTIIWLGETTRQEIGDLERMYNSDHLSLGLRVDKRGVLLPAWLFDYPSNCYAARDEALGEIRSSEFEFPRLESPIGAGVLAGRVAEVPNAGSLAVEARLLQDRLAKACLRRPVLFLHVLERFCRTALSREPFPFRELQTVLFHPSADHHTPLAVYDPLDSILALLKTLNSVACECPQTVRDFIRFRLVGPGVLRGQRNDESWQTIFAYCGGWGRLANGTQVRCGQNPIHLGCDQPCPKCGRLICHACGYCSHHCTECQSRQDGWASLPTRRLHRENPNMEQ